ncbi:hypothetical protein [Candidatus Protochlamydia amoebophila]|uniref:hypothetical protein n=1 Tax=Candidatus Protochlamydia amoebophila TaxID=362787 RepID=UPI001BC9A79F|nr:hypothetical protein [Candidatus Protochlamydia amoebophila]
MADKRLQLYVWTHYYEEEHCKKFFLRKRFGAATSATYEGFNDERIFIDMVQLENGPRLLGDRLIQVSG